MKQRDERESFPAEGKIYEVVAVETGKQILNIKMKNLLF